MADKLDQLYDALKADGAVSKDRENFRKKMLASGNEGYQNRKALYEALKADGAVDSKNYGEFRDRLGIVARKDLGKQHGSSLEEYKAGETQKTSATPMTESQKAGYSNFAAGIAGNAAATVRRGENQLAFQNANSGLQVKPVKLGQNSKVVERKRTNPLTGKEATTYITESGNEYADRGMADLEQNETDKIKYDNTIDGQLESLYKERDRIASEMDKREKETEKTRKEQRLARAIEAAGEPFYYANTVSMYEDKGMKDLESAARKNMNAIQVLEDKKRGKTDSFWHSLGTELMNGYLFTDGMSEYRDFAAMQDAAKHIDKINEKRKSGEPLTDEERRAEMVLSASAGNDAVQGMYGNDYGKWARAGKMTAGSIDFMKDFFTGAGAEGLVKGAAKKVSTELFKGAVKAGVTRIGRKAATETAKKATHTLAQQAAKKMVKATGVLVGANVVGGAYITNVSGAGHTLGRISEKMEDSVSKDDKGNWKVESGEGFLPALADAEREGLRENGSEMFGVFVPGAGTMAMKGLKRLGLSKVAGALTKMGSKPWYKRYESLLSAGGYNGLPGEVLEEYEGSLFDALTGHLDDAKRDMGDIRNHVDIWLGCATTGALLGAVPMVAQGVHTAQYYRYKNKREKADRVASFRLGAERWNPLREKIDGTDNGNMLDVVSGIVNDKSMHVEEKRAALEYVRSLTKERGFNIAEVNNAGESKDKTVEGVNDSYANGYNTTEDRAMSDARLRYEMRKSALAQKLGLKDWNDVDDVIGDPLEYMEEQRKEGNTALGDVIEYANAKSAYEGMMQRVRDDMDAKVDESNAAIDGHTNRRDGMIHPAVMRDDRKVYVVNGDVVALEDGSGVDRERSSESVIVRDAETGELEQVSPESILSVGEMEDAQIKKETAATAIREQYARETADKIDGKVRIQAGDRYTIPDQDGNMVEVTVAANDQGVTENADGTVNVTDGKSVFTVPRETIQEQSDAASRERIAAEDEERKKGYGLNERVTLYDEEGNAVNGVVTSEADEDGRIEVQTDSPVNGKRVGLYTADELDGMSARESQEAEAGQAVDGASGEFMGIRTSGYEGIKDIEERPLLWERGAHAVPEDAATPTITTIEPQQSGGRASRTKGQSNGPSADKITNKDNEKQRDGEKVTQEENIKLSDEIDESGRQFVLTSDGELAFGEISEDTGLTAAPILLSEGMITNPATNDGYGLVHIEARHGAQIRKAGYKSVVDFIETVAKNYDVIKKGGLRDGNQTYRLQLTDKHNNTLMVELSGDGTYWNINTAGIFKTSYGKNNKEVYNRHTTAKQPVEVAETSQDAEHGDTQTSSSMNVPTSSDDKVTKKDNEKQGDGEKELEKGKLLYRFDGGAQTEHHPADVSVTASPENVQGETSSEGGASSISHADNTAPAISLESRGDAVSSTDKITKKDDKPQGRAKKSLAERKVEARERARKRYAARREERMRRKAEAERGYDLEPRTGAELAADLLGNGGIRLLRPSFLRHTGYGNEEANKMIGVFASREKGGMTLEEAGEKVMLADSEAGSHLLDQSDPNAGLEAILDVLRECKTKGELAGYILNRRKKEKEEDERAEREQEDAARDEYYQECYHMGYEEYTIYEEEVLPLYYEEEMEIPVDVRVANLEEMELKSREYENNGRETGGHRPVRSERSGEQGRDEGEHGEGEESSSGEVHASGGPVLEGASRGETGSEGVEPSTEEGALKPVGRGAFGNIYDQFRGKAQKAFEFLLRKKNGDLIGVFHRDGVGDIDLVWGDKGGGFDHIVSKHIGEGKSFSTIDEAAQVIDDIIKTGKNDFEDGDKIVFKKGSKLVTIRKNVREKGKKIADKNWVLTAYDELSADGDVSAIAPTNEVQAARHTDETRNKVTKKNGAKPEKTEKNVDSQGNPLNADGTLKVEKINSIDELTDDDFMFPTRNVQLPYLPKVVDEAIGAKGKPVVIKKNIFGKNKKSHKDVTAEQGREILKAALYSPDLYGQNKKTTRPYNWILIHNATLHSSVVLEVNHNKDNVEIVNWHYLDNDALGQKERQAIMEGGLILTLESAAGNTNDGLSSADKVTNKDGKSQGKQEKKDTSSSREEITDVGEKIGGARKDLYEEMQALAKENSQKSDEDLKSWIAKLPVSKIFNFDIAKLRAEGLSNEAATFIQFVKSYVPAKPRTGWKLNHWFGQALSFYRLCLESMVDFEKVQGVIKNDSFHTLLEGYNALMAVGGFDSGLHLPKGTLLRHCKEGETIWSSEKGDVSVAGKWEVIMEGVYYNFKFYDTYEEAVEALKKLAGENAVPKKKEIEFVVYGRKKEGTFFITPKGKSDVVIADGFKTSTEAFKYISENNDELQERYRTLMDGTTVKLGENRERKGRNWRDGKDVSAEDFRNTFGFRGVEFGNWMKQEDRRKALNECYDALMDLADVCGVSPQALSLDGKLGMAFGARGGGKANAHYEPGKNVINLTKTKGAGALAHEWFHAIDAYFARMGGAEAGSHATSKEGLAPKGLQTFDTRNGKIYWSGTQHKYLTEAEYEAELAKHPVRKEMAEAWKHLIDTIEKSAYGKRSQAYASLHGGYWNKPTEMGARAFSVWVENELSKRNATNDYLANNPALLEEALNDNDKGYAPYPFNTDAEWMDEAFGNLFNTMQEKVDAETGNHVLYHKSEGARPVTREEAVLRDALDEVMRGSGLDVLGDEVEGQWVLDWANGEIRLSASHRSEESEQRNQMWHTVDSAVALVTGKTEKAAREERRKQLREIAAERKKLYESVLSGDFNKVTLQLINDYIDHVTPNNRYYRPLSQRLPSQALRRLHARKRTGSIDALFSRICESAVPKNGRVSAEGKRRIEEKKKELLKGWAIATGNWHTSVSDFAVDETPIGKGKDSTVYQEEDGKHVVKVSKGKDNLRKFRPDIDAVALFNSVFPESRYEILGYGEVDGKFVKFLRQPFVDFAASTPLTVDERVAYMGKLGFEPMNDEKTVFSNGTLVVADLQGSNIVKDGGGNVRVIDADVKLHTKDIGGKWTYPDVETDTEVAETPQVREQKVYHGSGADFDAFDHSHMGEGEGAQAYGWGTYVTEVEGIGRAYAESYGDAPRTGKEAEIRLRFNKAKEKLNSLRRLRRKTEKYEGYIEYMLKDIEDTEDRAKGYDAVFQKGTANAWRRHAEKLKSKLNKAGHDEAMEILRGKIAEAKLEADEAKKEYDKVRPVSTLYTVDIPDDNGSNYLEWDGRVSNMGQDALDSIDNELTALGWHRSEIDDFVRFTKGDKKIILNPRATGADLYAELEEGLGNAKAASNLLSEAGFAGIKYPAQFRSGGRADGAKNYVIFQESDARITDKVRFFRTRDGEAYGFTVGGKIYYDPRIATSETLVHEYAHLWSTALKAGNPKEWANVVGLMKGTVVWDKVREMYPELETDDEIADEVIAQYSGKRGAERLRAEQKRIMEGNGSVFEKAEAVSALQRVREALRKFWKGVCDFLHIHYTSADEVADRVMRDLLDGVDPRKFGMEDGLRMSEDNEIKDIIAKAKADGTYMKAPNGEPTNLNERQWAQVRTKAFKKWFGDWLKAARIEKLRKSEPIVITGEEITPSDDLNQYKKNALEYGKSLRGDYTNKDTGAKIQINAQSIKEVLHHDYKNAAHLQSVAAIPQMIENGIFIDSLPNEDTDKNSKVSEYQYYVCGLKIGGVDYTVKFVVAIDVNGNRYYDHKLTEIEKGKLLNELDRITSPSSREESALSENSQETDSSANLVESVGKDTRLISILQTNSSKVVDENGEPRVVYHQTNSTVWVNRETGENYEDLDWKEKDYWQNEASQEEWEETWEEQDFYTFDNKNHGRRSVEMPAFFFAPEYDEYHEYGDRTIEAFLNIKNPAINPTIENAGVYDDAGEKAMQKLIDEGYDGFIREYDGTIEEINAFSPNQIKSATDNVGTFDAGNNDIRYQFVGESGAANADHAEEVTTRLDNLEVAREMEEAKKDAKSIKMATGWERGADGKWRYEIPDIEFVPEGNADLNRRIAAQPWGKEFNALLDRMLDGETLSETENKRFGELSEKSQEIADVYNNQDEKVLADYVRNDDLFKAYPQLKAMKVVFFDERDWEGKYAEKENTIYIKEDSVLPRDEILAHEIQHAIQRIEGFALGTNVDYIDDIKWKISNIRKRAEYTLDYTAYNHGVPTLSEWMDSLDDEGKKSLATELGRVRKKHDDFHLLYAYLDLAGFNNTDRRALKLRLTKATKEIAELLQKIGGNSFANNYTIYRRYAGEVESRNVQKRMGMTAEERRASLAAETADVSRDDQIFLFGEGGESRSESEKVLDVRTMQDEEKQKRGERLLQTEAIEVAGNQIQKTESKSARQVALDWWRVNVGEPRSYDTEVGTVDIDEKSIGDSLAHGYNQAKLDAVTSLVDGFGRAVYLGSMPDFTRQEGVQSHYFAYPINYDGKRSYVFCRAMQDTNKNRLYVHEVFVADNLNNKGNTLQTAAFQPHGGIALYKNILSDFLSAANVGRSSETPKESEEKSSQEVRVRYQFVGERGESHYEMPDDAQGEIEEVNAKFNERLQSLAENPNQKEKVLSLGRTSDFLKKGHIADAEIILEYDKLVRKSNESYKNDHPFDVEDIKDLPQAIHAPIAVFENTNGKDSGNVILTELKKDGHNFIVVVRAEQQHRKGGVVLEVNEITTLFPKDARGIIHWFNLRKATNVDKEKALHFIEALRNHRGTTITSKELSDAAKVVETFGNPTPESEKSSQEMRVRFSKVAKDEPEYEKTLARESYERRVRSGLYQSREALLDSMEGLRAGMEEILRAESGGTWDGHIEDVDGYENAYLGENALSSVNQAESDAAKWLLFNPLYEEIAALDRAGLKRDALTEYMMAKHGLERNEFMALRDAQRQTGKEFEDELRAAEKALAKDPLDEKLQADLDDVKQRMGDREEELYFANRGRDYAGLTALYGTKNVMEAERKARLCVDYTERNYDTAALWQRARKVSDAIVEKQYECGMMSRETADMIKGMYKNYIPLRGFAEDTAEDVYAYTEGGRMAFNAPIRKAKGRSSVADDPIANLCSMMDSAIMAGNRNKLVRQRLLNFVLNHPSDLVSVSDVWLVHDDVSGEWRMVMSGDVEGTEALEESDSPSEVERKMRDFEERMRTLSKENPKKYRRQRENPDIPYRVTGKADMREHQIVVRRNGKDWLLTVNGSPRLAQSVNGLTNPDHSYEGMIGRTINMVGTVNRTLSALYTTLEPNFVASNFVRDLLLSNSMVWVKESPQYAFRYNRNYAGLSIAKMKRLIGKYRRNELDESVENEMLFRQFMEHGGETGFVRMMDMEEYKKQASEALKSLSERIPARKARELLAMQIGEWGRGIEMMARFAAFKTSRQAGRSIDRSIWDSKEISVNFNKKGAGDRFLGANGQTRAGNVSAAVSGAGRLLYIFWNAALQGTFNNFVKYGMRNKGKTVGMMAAYFTLGLLIAAMNSGDDDDEGNNGYYDASKHVRRQNVLFRIYGKNYGKIPLPIEYRSVYGLGEMAGSTLFQREALDAEDIAGQLSQLFPVDMMEGASSLVPSAARTAWDTYNNRTWYGSPIWKESAFNKYHAQWTKAYRSTNKHLVRLAEALSDATGGDPYTKRKGAIDLNPGAIEYLAKGYAGGIFNNINMLVNLADVAAGQKDFDWRYVPLANRVLMTAGDEQTSGRGLNEKYYDYMETFRQHQSEFSAVAGNMGIPMLKKAELVEEIAGDAEYVFSKRVSSIVQRLTRLSGNAEEAGKTAEKERLDKEIRRVKKDYVERMEHMSSMRTNKEKLEYLRKAG